jgi:hypothetical protein
VVGRKERREGGREGQLQILGLLDIATISVLYFPS